MGEEALEKRKGKLAAWLKKPENLILLAIIILGLGLRTYYVTLTADQPLWWDEAEYGATAKHWALGVPFDLVQQRPPLFQFLWAVLINLSLSDSTIKFLLVAIPSTVLICIVYYLGKEMYNKKIGLIAAFLTSLSWSYVFWTARFQPDFFSLCFQILSVLFMWKYWRGDKKPAKNAILAGMFSALGFYFKISALLVPLSFFFFAIIRDKHRLFLKKEYYYAGLAFLITLIPYFLWSLIAFGDPVSFRVGYSNDVIRNSPFGWNNLNFYYFMTDNVLFWIFIIGFIISLRFLLYLDILLKGKDQKPLPHLYSVILLATVSAFYIFYMRGTDDRWVFLWMPFIFFICGEGMTLVVDKFLKNYKYVGTAVIIVLLGTVAYMEYQHFDDLIKLKKDSYGPVRLAGLWLKENTHKEDPISTVSYVQIIYYSEGNVTNYSPYKNATSFSKYLEDTKTKYLVFSIFEPITFSPEFTWMPEYIANNTNRFVPVRAYFSDEAQKNAVLIIYKVNS